MEVGVDCFVNFSALKKGHPEEEQKKRKGGGDALDLKRAKSRLGFGSVEFSFIE